MASRITSRLRRSKAIPRHNSKTAMVGSVCVTDLILAIDQGTTGSTIALMDTDGRLLTSVNHEFPQIFPQPGWVEHDPESIWQSVLKGLTAIFSDTQYAVSQVAAIGITNQRETAVLWDSQTGEAVHNAIVWQCRRTTDVCEGLKPRVMKRSSRPKVDLCSILTSLPLSSNGYSITHQTRKHFWPRAVCWPVPSTPISCGVSATAKCIKPMYRSLAYLVDVT